MFFRLTNLPATF
jgi:Reverse transcriptase (RNA-dependent DNA polymerase)